MITTTEKLIQLEKGCHYVMTVHLSELNAAFFSNIKQIETFVGCHIHIIPVHNMEMMRFEKEKTVEEAKDGEARGLTDSKE